MGSIILVVIGPPGFLAPEAPLPFHGLLLELPEQLHIGVVVELYGKGIALQDQSGVDTLFPDLRLVKGVLRSLQPDHPQESSVLVPVRLIPGEVQGIHVLQEALHIIGGLLSEGGIPAFIAVDGFRRVDLQETDLLLFPIQPHPDGISVGDARKLCLFDSLCLEFLRSGACCPGPLP